MGDFAHRRLPEAFRAVWDQWLQRGMSRLRDRADWTERYLEAPIWCFALGRQVAGDQAWIGVLMPSVDGVGRYFPFALAVELDASVPGCLQGEALAAALRWWAFATQAALEGLDGDLDAVRFDAVLQPETRSLWERLLAQGWVDATRRLHPHERIYTFWVNADAFRRNAGFRMDFLLLTPALAKRLVATGVDREQRGREKPSDHAPVWIELEASASAATSAR